MYKVIPLQTNKLANTKDADILEVWFDSIPKKEHASLLKRIKKPFIYKLEKSDPKKLNEAIIREAQYIDIDYQAPKATFKKAKKINPKITIIISYHNFKQTPYEKDLNKIYKKMTSKLPAQTKNSKSIVKFATSAKGIVDSFRMLDFLANLSKKGQNTICLCMGEHGLLTRISGHLFGNHMMYFSATSKTTSKTAPGQITIKEFNKYTHES
jgi:3-dehydroquinate dehydratase type I